MFRFAPVPPSEQEARTSENSSSRHIPGDSLQLHSGALLIYGKIHLSDIGRYSKIYLLLSKPHFRYLIVEDFTNYYADVGTADFVEALNVIKWHYCCNSTMKCDQLWGLYVTLIDSSLCFQ